MNPCTHWHFEQNSARAATRKGQEFGMGRYLGIGFVVAFAAIFGLHFVASSAREPSYGGKSISQWLDGGYEDAAMALQQIGPAAGPYVLAKLAREDGRYGTSVAYGRFWTKLPMRLRGIFPKARTGNFSDLRATSALLELGPPIKPLLRSHLADGNPAVRIACARTLGILAGQGSDIGTALEPLSKAARDPNAVVAATARAALSELEGRAAARP